MVSSANCVALAEELTAAAQPGRWRDCSLRAAAVQWLALSHLHAWQQRVRAPLSDLLRVGSESD